MTAREITIAPVRDTLPLGALIEPAELDGAAMWTVTTHDGQGRPRRRWFDCRALAWAHAADQADALNLPLLSLDGAAPEGEG